MIIRCIDPGPVESAYVDYDGGIIAFGMFKNIDHTNELSHDHIDHVFIEMIACYGMPAGKDLFETALWIGRFWQQYVDVNIVPHKVYRRDVKLHLCGNMQAKDKNVITAIVDRFDPNREFGQYGKGTKRHPGPLYGMAKDCWQALALALTVYDRVRRTAA